MVTKTKKRENTDDACDPFSTNTAGLGTIKKAQYKLSTCVMQAADVLGCCLGMRSSGIDSSVEGKNRGVEYEFTGSTSNQCCSCSSNLNIQQRFHPFYPDVGHHLFPGSPNVDLK